MFPTKINFCTHNSPTFSFSLFNPQHFDMIPSFVLVSEKRNIFLKWQDECKNRGECSTSIKLQGTPKTLCFSCQVQQLIKPESHYAKQHSSSMTLCFYADKMAKMFTFDGDAISLAINHKSKLLWWFYFMRIKCDRSKKPIFFRCWCFYYSLAPPWWLIRRRFAILVLPLLRHLIFLRLVNRRLF